MGQELKPTVDFPSLEQEIIAFWQKNNIFEKSLAKSKANNNAHDYVFYDGPPFANGLPHYGHLLTGYVKDVIPRYKTMQGEHVPRVFGWDTHGLPAELEAERELGISDKSQIDEMGIKEFNKACEKSVLKYTNVWQDYVNRSARWVDFAAGYKTLDITYMESVIWAFKELYKKGLVYQSYKVLPYCWKDQTPLSNHELRMDDEVYKNRQDISVTLGVRLCEPLPDIPQEYLQAPVYALIWTTTPWTLPSNFAIAVGRDIEYVVVAPSKEASLASENKLFLLAKSRLKAYEKEIGQTPQIVATYSGQSLVSNSYYPIFDYYNTAKYHSKIGQKIWSIVIGDHVTTEDGSGIVHMAPFGEEDMTVFNQNDLIPEVSIDEAAVFVEQISDYAGQFIFDANKQILRDLRNASGSQERITPEKRAVFVSDKSIEHSYPHCWRCRNPLIYKPVSSWFVKVSAIKDKLLELAKQINWIPQSNIFESWLSGARDWAISRNRFWGAPIPVWVSDDPNYPRIDVYGSIAELEADFGVQITNLHRPEIDDLVRPNPDDPTGKAMMRRTSDVLDCWFESGAMPFAQKHYPFENKQWFENNFPSDFVVEYVGQTRGWFYNMHVLAGALFNRIPFRNVMCHGIVLGDDGQKMSKSLRNFPDITTVFNLYGSDAMRWFLMSTGVLKGGNIIVKEEAIKTSVRSILLPLWSCYYFLDLYTSAANKGAGYQAKALTDERIKNLDNLDRFILSSLKGVLIRSEKLLNDYDLAGACGEYAKFLDDLTNWYIRGSRSRFWDEDIDAFDTLWTVLEILLRAMAPLLPLVCERIYLGIKAGDSGDIFNPVNSVHLQNWPSATNVMPDDLVNILPSDDDLLTKTAVARSINSNILALRKKHDLKVRQPLNLLTVFVQNPQDFIDFIPLLTKELNVKKILFNDLQAVSQEQFGIKQVLNVNARLLGPRIGSGVQPVIKASKMGSWHIGTNGFPIVNLSEPIIDKSGQELTEVELTEGEFSLETVIESVDNTSKNDSDCSQSPSCQKGLSDSEGLSDNTKQSSGSTQAVSMIAGGGFAILDIELTDELVAEGVVRDLIRKVQETRKTTGLNIADRITLTIKADKNTISAAEQFADLLKNETLATDLNLEIANRASGNEEIITSAI